MLSPLGGYQAIPAPANGELKFKMRRVPVPGAFNEIRSAELKADLKYRLRRLRGECFSNTEAQRGPADV